MFPSNNDYPLCADLNGKEKPSGNFTKLQCFEERKKVKKKLSKNNRNNDT